MATLIAVIIRLEDAKITRLKRFSYLCSATFSADIKSISFLSHIYGQYMMVLKICKTNISMLIILHFRIFRNIRVIWSFCIGLFFFLIFILNRLPLNRRKSPRLNHRTIPISPSRKDGLFHAVQSVQASLSTLSSAFSS